MKRKLRRLTALALTVSMIMSMVGIIPALAADSSGQIDGGEAGYAYYPQDGTLETTYDGLGGQDWNTPSPTYEPKVGVEDGAVSVSKTIKPTGEENEFIITLEVNTIQKIQSLKLSSDAAVVLVIDNSSSMYQNVADSLNGGKGNSTKLVNSSDKVYLENAPRYTNWEGNLSRDYVKLPNNVSDGYFEYVKGAITYGRNNDKYIPYIQNARIPLSGNDIADWRITQAKNAATAFANSFMNDTSTTGARYLSVVSFSNYATVETPWTQEYNAVTTAIDAMRPINMTYMAPGLNKALELLQDPSVSGIKNKYVILLADGAASDNGPAITASQNVDNNENTDLYTVSFASKNAMSNLAGTEYNSSNFEALIKNLADIQLEIKKAAEAWTVSDPMGKYIKLDQDSFKLIECEKVSEFVSATADGFTWDLKNVTPKKTTGGNGKSVYTYKMQYNIELDTHAEGFEEDTYYLTNGKTSLDYCIKTSNNDEISSIKNGTVDFLVPAVCGTIPMYEYDIEYYIWDKTTGTYPTDPIQAQRDIDVKLWETIELPSGYNEKFSADDYDFNSYELVDAEDSTVTGLQIVEDEMTLKLYYAPIATNVTVNHFQRIGTYDENGVLTWAEYPETPVVTEYISTDTYVGDSFTLADSYLRTSTLGNLDETKDNSMELTSLVKSDDATYGENNVINLYYEKTEGIPKSATINVYETWQTLEYDLVDGVYEAVPTKVVTSNGPTLNNSETLDYLGNHTVNLPTYTEAADGTRVSVKLEASDMTILEGDTVTVNATEDKGVYNIYIVYQMINDNRGEEITVEVEHYYTRHETKIVDGAQTNPNTFVNVLGNTMTYTGYPAEALNIDEYLLYTSGAGTEQYNSDAGNADKIAQNTTFESANGKDINLHYNLSIEPTPADVTVTHIFYTLDPVVDEDNGTVTWERRTDPDATDVVSYPNDGTKMYVDQKKTAPLNPENRTGYDYIGTEAEREITLTADTSDNITLYYEKNAGEEPTTASVSLIHEYYVDVERVVDGVRVTEREFVSKTAPETVWGVSGDTYTGFVADTSYGTRFDTVGDDLTATYGGSDIVLKYVKAGEGELKAATLTVDHEYYTETMTVQNGVADYYDAEVLDNSATPVTTLIITDKNGNSLNPDELYANMQVTVSTVTEYNGIVYSPKSSNPALTIILNEGANSLSLDYIRQVPLDKVNVYVTDTYYLTTYSYDGVGNESSETTRSYGRTDEAIYATKYVGEDVEITTNPNGYNLDSVKIVETDVPTDAEGKYIVTASADKKVDLVYSKSTGKGQPTKVIVNHYYTEYDKGVIKSGYGIDAGYVPDTQTISSFVGQQYTATPNYKYNDGGTNGYDLVLSQATPTFDSGYTITLVADNANEINLYYEKDIENRTPVTVTVKHTYGTYDKYLEEYVNVAEDAALAKTEIYTNGLGEDGVWVAWVGMDYTATENLIEEYIRQTADEDMTLTLTATPELNVIEIYYEREINTKPSGGKNYYTLTVNWVDENGNDLVAQEKTSNMSYAEKYDTEKKNIDGYSFLKMDKDSDPASGSMFGSKHVIYVYTADQIDIPEETPPLETPPVETPPTETPTTDIPEGDTPKTDIPEGDVPMTDIPEGDVPMTDIPTIPVPLSDIPQTGDNRNLPMLMATALLSAAGLIVLLHAEAVDKKD